MCAFHGIPYAPPNRWEVHHHHYRHNSHLLSATDSGDGRQGAPFFWLTVRDLKFYADFYNAHHACCWPRVLLDAHVGHMAERSETPPTRETAHGNAADREIEASGLGAVAAEQQRLRHVVSVMEQLALSQTEKLPRAPEARRIVFEGEAPPVLRCHRTNDPFVYLLSGGLRLYHRCHPHHREGSRQEEKRRCRHAPTPVGLARDVFPLLLVMAPTSNCEAYVDAEPPVATAATEWKTKPLVLALESVQVAPTADSPVSHEGGPRPWEGREVGEEEGEQEGCTLWQATYTAFTWVCNALGNKHASTFVKSSVATPRQARSRPPSESTTATPPLTPLMLSFDVYASEYTSEDAKRQVLTALSSRYAFTPNITKAIRFGLGGADPKKRKAIGWEEEKVTNALARRPAQLMQLLDRCIPREIVRHDGERAAALASAAVGSTKCSTRSSSSSSSSSLLQPLKRVRCIPPVASGAVEAAEARPAATMTLLATLKPQRRIEREWCRMPRSTTLSAVLPQPATALNSASGEESSSVWPLRVVPNPPTDGTDATSGVLLSPLSSLGELAAALRRMCVPP